MHLPKKVKDIQKRLTSRCTEVVYCRHILPVLPPVRDTITGSTHETVADRTSRAPQTHLGLFCCKRCCDVDVVADLRLDMLA